MELLLGVDTLSYHCRLAGGEISLDDVLTESAELGARFVQVNARHLRDRDDSGLAALRTRAESLDLALTLSGDIVGIAGRGDEVQEGADRVARWLELAAALGSPYARVSSGFYRAELWREPERIRDEQRYLTEALSRAADENRTGVRILLENHSDFTPQEYVEIVESVGHERLGVFLDLINAVSVFAEPIGVVRDLLPWAHSGHIKDFWLQSEYVEDGFHRRGFAVRWCYPGEGVADLESLLGLLASTERAEPYLLSIEGLDNYARRPDQRARIGAALEFIGHALAR